MAPDERPRNLLPYLAGAVVLVFLAMRVLGASGGAGTPAVALDGAGPKATRKPVSGDRIWVHVAGAVRRPGLYRVAADARAGAAVDAAGGVARRADLRAINLAATVRDGQQVIVPARGERPAVAGPGAAASGDASQAPGSGSAPPGGATGAPGTAGPAPGGAKISLTTATVEQLDGLDGIGPTLAQRILQWRDAHGGFKSVDQLREVEGIGEKRFEALRGAVAP
jgi:competence protein ComEA